MIKPCYFTLKKMVIITQIPPFCDISFNISSYYAYLCSVWVKAILNKKETSQTLLKPNFKAFWQSEESFSKVWFLVPWPPLQDFIFSKSPGLRGFIAKYQSLVCFRFEKLNSKYSCVFWYILWKIFLYFYTKFFCWYQHKKLHFEINMKEAVKSMALK